MSRVVTWDTSMSALGPSVVAVGVFDGVHVGHQALIREAVALSRQADVEAVVLTFDRDPDQVVTPAAAVPQLLDLCDKLEFLAEAGADVVLVVPFTRELSEWGRSSSSTRSSSGHESSLGGRRLRLPVRAPRRGRRGGAGPIRGGAWFRRRCSPPRARRGAACDIDRIRSS